MFDKQKLENGEKYNKKERQFDLFKSTKIEPVIGGQQNAVDADIWQGQAVGSSKIRASKIFLLTNPFFTTSHDGKAFVLHLIGATTNGDVYHKTIGWKIDLSDTAKKDGEIYRYDAASDLLDKGRYDNIQILKQDKALFDLKQDKSWTKAKGWEPNFINANLRVNKNMFDENSIVFAYPYSSSSDVTGGSSTETYGDQGKAMPVFNVVQISLDKNNALIKSTKETTQKDNINYNFGKQIDDYYTEHGSEYSTDRWNNYPYPTPDSFDERNFNHSYNRLISVSPFDNTIIYAGKPNVRDGIFGPYTVSNRDSWAGFWIANSWDLRRKKYYHPLIIGNDGSIVSSSDRFDSTEMGKMLNNINDLYRDGFTFDVASAYEPDTFRLSLNLYFHQTGSGINSSYENKDPDFKTSKIGLIRDVLYDSGSHQEGNSGDRGWAKDVVTKFPEAWNDGNKKLFATTINNDSFSSLIHSRAKLEQWYPRTFANLNFPSNMLKAKEIFWINSQERSDIAVANKFDTKLTGPIFTGTNKSIDLVSALKDNGESVGKYNRRFARLIMKRPMIQVGTDAVENGLNLVVNYQLESDIKTKIINKRGWQITDSKVQEKLLLTQNAQVQNTSVQILSAWGDSYKMKKIFETTAQINKNNTDWNQEINVTNKLDKKDYPDNPDKISFGNRNNNNMTRNGTTALRSMLKIVKPTGNLPDWFNRINSAIFNRAYPIEPAFTGETTFQEIAKQFADEKARLMDLSQESNAAVSFANLTIEASLELNPKFANYNANDKFYSGINGLNGILRGSKILIDKSKNNQRFIYADKDAPANAKTIYDQSSITYGDLTTSNGFTNFLSTDAWAQNHEIGSRKSIKVTTDYSKLEDKLVRKNSGDTTTIFIFDYQSGKKYVL